MASPTTEIKKALPQPNSDFYELVETLPAEELAVVKQVRAFMETKVAPIITKYWVEDSFPFELLPAIKELNIGGVGMKGYGCRGGSAQLFGLIAMEMARIDCSLSLVHFRQRYSDCRSADFPNCIPKVPFVLHFRRPACRKIASI